MQPAEGCLADQVELGAAVLHVRMELRAPSPPASSGAVPVERASEGLSERIAVHDSVVARTIEWSASAAGLDANFACQMIDAPHR
jgi:hypothetical protein